MDSSSSQGGVDTLARIRTASNSTLPTTGSVPSFSASLRHRTSRASKMEGVPYPSSAPATTKRRPMKNP
ncbi:unnamed protein product [Spirodela intermedia]|uniref:Uncharacterized protein n=1 Tax=Spirodela intermedia TaxID=51605 RepID=A0A7I8KQZ8_SPIIN|nr:unnamed protein product [Spirodela intermedia]